MIHTACPHCGRRLNVDEKYADQVLKCAGCQGFFVAPSPQTTSDSATEAKADNDAKYAFIAISVSLTVLLFLALGFFRGFAIAVMCTAIVVVAQIAIWNWSLTLQLVNWLLEEWDRHAQARAARLEIERQRNVESPPVYVPTTQRHEPLNPTDSPRTSASSGNTTEARQASSKPPPPSNGSAWPEVSLGGGVSPRSDRQTQERSKTAAPARSEQLPWYRRVQQPRRTSETSSPPLSRWGAKIPNGGPWFFGIGTSIDLGFGSLVDPLIYASCEPCYGSFDPSLIDSTLPVIAPTGGLVEELPYWPNYSEFLPSQRARYLAWLLSGKTAPDIEIGYVFTYFYGLEHRVLSDGADYAAIAAETMRLHSQYRANRSFDRYACGFLASIVALSARSGGLPEEIVDRAFGTIRKWDNGQLSCFLAERALRGKPLSAEMAFAVTELDPRKTSSVIVRRHGESFRDLFVKKYRSALGDGIVLKTAKRALALPYAPASALMARQRTEPTWPSIPDVLGITSQFKPLVTLWDECVDELKAYDRAHRKSYGRMTAEMWEAQPSELRTGDHPDLENWLNLWQSKIDSEGVPIVTFGDLASLKGIAQRKTLTKTQSNSIAITADALGIGIEPDPRLSGANPAWIENATLFFREDSAPPSFDGYQAAVTLLRLGMHVASADGSCAEVEVAHVASQLETLFNLSADQRKRLESLRTLLLRTGQSHRDILKALNQKLSAEHRFLVAEFLVGVAAIDQEITPDEMRVLQQLFQELEVPLSRLKALLADVVPAEKAETKQDERPAQASGDANLAHAKSASTFHLDLAAVSRIMHETRAVASILNEAMSEVPSDDTDDDDAKTSVDPIEVPFRYSPQPGTPTEDAQVGASSTSVAMAHAPHENIDDTLSGATEPKLDTSVQETSAAGLTTRYQPFWNVLRTRYQWSETEAKALAREHRVMLSGAIEAINDWSQERCGDWVIDGENPITVRLDLLEKL